MSAQGRESGMANTSLVIGGVLSGAAALVHIGIIYWQAMSVASLGKAGRVHV